VLQVAAVVARWGLREVLLEAKPALVLPELYLVTRPEAEPLPHVLRDGYLAPAGNLGSCQQMTLLLCRGGSLHHSIVGKDCTGVQPSWPPPIGEPRHPSLPCICWSHSL
jgi:hypothetical protein